MTLASDLSLQLWPEALGLFCLYFSSGQPTLNSAIFFSWLSSIAGLKRLRMKQAFTNPSLPDGMFDDQDERV